MLVRTGTIVPMETGGGASGITSADVAIQDYTSNAPLVANGTITRAGLAGYSFACAATAVNMQMPATTTSCNLMSDAPGE